MVRTERRMSCLKFILRSTTSRKGARRARLLLILGIFVSVDQISDSNAALLPGWCTSSGSRRLSRRVQPSSEPDEAASTSRASTSSSHLTAATSSYLSEEEVEDGAETEDPTDENEIRLLSTELALAAGVFEDVDVARSRSVPRASSQTQTFHRQLPVARPVAEVEDPQDQETPVPMSGDHNITKIRIPSAGGKVGETTEFCCSICLSSNVAGGVEIKQGEAPAVPVEPTPRTQRNTGSAADTTSPGAKVEQAPSMSENDFVVLRPCGHAFHIDCVCRWLFPTGSGPENGFSSVTEKQCPVCRANIEKDFLQKVLRPRNVQRRTFHYPGREQSQLTRWPAYLQPPAAVLDRGTYLDRGLWESNYPPPESNFPPPGTPGWSRFYGYE